MGTTRFAFAFRGSIGIAITLCLTSCAPLPSEKTSGTVHHIVICWLKNPGDVAARRKLIEVSKGFGDIPGILSVRAGEPQISDRRNVDPSFDVAIIMEFEDTHALAAYQEHPRHSIAIRDVLAPLTTRVVIYDFTD